MYYFANFLLSFILSTLINGVKKMAVWLEAWIDLCYVAYILLGKRLGFLHGAERPEILSALHADCILTSSKTQNWLMYSCIGMA